MVVVVVLVVVVTGSVVTDVLDVLVVLVVVPGGAVVVGAMVVDVVVVAISTVVVGLWVSHEVSWTQGPGTPLLQVLAEIVVAAASSARSAESPFSVHRISAEMSLYVHPEIV